MGQALPVVEGYEILRHQLADVFPSVQQEVGHHTAPAHLTLEVEERFARDVMGRYHRGHRRDQRLPVKGELPPDGGGVLPESLGGSQVTMQVVADQAFVNPAFQCLVPAGKPRPLRGVRRKAQLAFQAAQVVGQDDFQQGRHPVTVFFAGLLVGGVEPQAHAPRTVPGTCQRREKRVVGTFVRLGGDGFGQVAEIPGGNAVAFPVLAQVLQQGFPWRLRGRCLQHAGVAIDGQGLARRPLERKAHPEVGRQIGFGPSCCRNVDLEAAVDEIAHGGQQIPVALRHFTGDHGRGIADRREASPVAFGQRLEQGRDLFLDQAGHEPVGIGGIDPVGAVGRHRHGDAVVLASRVEAVFGLETGAPQFDFLRVQGQLVRIGFGLQEILGPEAQEIVATFLLDASGQRAQVGHGPQAVAVELVEDFLVHQQAAPAKTILHIGHIVDQRLVVVHEGQRLADIAVDEGAAHEDFRGLLGRDACVGDPAPGDDHQTKEADLLVGHHLTAFAGPARRQISMAALRPGQRFEPGAVDIGDRAREKPRGVDHLRSHDPVAGAVEQPRPGKKHALAPPGRPEDILFPALGDIGQKPAQNRDVDGRVERPELLGTAVGGRGRRRARILRQPRFGGDGFQLAVDVAPFPYPAEGDEMLPAEALQGPAAYDAA